MIVLLLPCVCILTLSLSGSLIFISPSDIRKKIRRKFFIYLGIYALTQFGFYMQQPFLYSLYLFNKYSTETIALLIITSYIFEELATLFPFELYMEFSPKISYMFFQLFAILSCLLRFIGGPINHLCANALISFSRCSVDKFLTEYRSNFYQNDADSKFAFSNNLRFTKVLLFLFTAGSNQLIFSNSSSNLDYIYLMSMIYFIVSVLSVFMYKSKQYEPKKNEKTTKNVYLLAAYLFYSLIKIMIFPRFRFFIDSPDLNNIALLHTIVFCSGTMGDICGYFSMNCIRPHIVLCFSSMILAGFLYALSFLVHFPYIAVADLTLIVFMFHVTGSFFNQYIKLSILHRIIIVFITSSVFFMLCNAKPNMIANVSSLFAIMMNMCSLIFTLDLPK